MKIERKNIKYIKIYVQQMIIGVKLLFFFAITNVRINQFHNYWRNWENDNLNNVCNEIFFVPKRATGQFEVQSQFTTFYFVSYCSSSYLNKSSVNRYFAIIIRYSIVGMIRFFVVVLFSHVSLKKMCSLWNKICYQVWNANHYIFFRFHFISYHLMFFFW